MRILVDPGHGLYYKENEYVFQRPFFDDMVEDLETVYFARSFCNKLSEYDVELFVTRDIYEDEIGISNKPKFYEGAWCFLKECEVIDNDMYRHDVNIRWDYANNLNADLFLSFHFNASNGSRRGTEIYINQKNKITRDLANIYSQHLRAEMPISYFPDIRILDGMDYAVIKYSTMSAMLIELLFIDNEKDRLLMNDFIYNLMSDMLVLTITNYFGIL